MKNLLGNSSMPNYVKLMAASLLGMTYLAALAVATASYIGGGPNAAIPGTVSFILGTGLGLALNVLGLHQGVQISEGSPASFGAGFQQGQQTKEAQNASTPTA